jgi:hypothetical protein
VRGNYSPDKEFRYLRHVVTHQTGWLPVGGLGHFCLALHVAMQVGLYLHINSGELSMRLACSL